MRLLRPTWWAGTLDKIMTTKRKLGIIAIVLAAIFVIIAIIVAIVVAVVALGSLHTSQREPNRQREFALPFTGLHDPRGVALDSAGNVYVADSGNNRVLKLAAGSSTQTVLPFTGLALPAGVAVDTVGNVYVADPGHDSEQDDRVLKLAAGSDTQTVLPSTRGATPDAVAVDTAGTVYASVFAGCGRQTCSHLIRLAAGSDSWTDLASAGVEQYVAVDTDGNVYVITAGDTAGVMRLAHGSSAWTKLPEVTDFRAPGGLAVDARGNVYVTDALATGGSSVLKLPPG
jgi:DNA-binding beta-propeller fold protein YncE